MTDTKPDTGKTRWSLLPFEILRDVVKAFEAGLAKQGRQPDDWKRVPDAPRKYFDAALRHLTGEDADDNGLDNDTGLCQYVHLAATALILAWHAKQKRMGKIIARGAIIEIDQRRRDSRENGYD